MLDKETQETALNLAKTEVLKEFNEETKAYIENNFGDIHIFITNQIKATINSLKK
ncbi:MAG: hypothetical protein LKE36_02945 [Bacilli bacterium]|nr:hypothetical protein [Bacilli bacterium]